MALNSDKPFNLSPHGKSAGILIRLVTPSKPGKLLSSGSERDPQGTAGRNEHEPEIWAFTTVQQEYGHSGARRLVGGPMEQDSQLRLKDIFNVHALTMVWNGAATMYLAGGGPLPYGYNYVMGHEVSLPVMLGLGVLFTATSGLQWLRDISRRQEPPEAGRMSGGDEPSAHIP